MRGKMDPVFNGNLILHEVSEMNDDLMSILVFSFNVLLTSCLTLYALYCNLHCIECGGTCIAWHFFIVFDDDFC